MFEAELKWVLINIMFLPDLDINSTSFVYFFVKQDFKKVNTEILVSTKNCIAKCGAQDDDAWKRFTEWTSWKIIRLDW